MGAGLRKVAKLHGGLTVTDHTGKTVKYNGDGKIVSKSQEKRVSTLLKNQIKPTENK